MLASFGEFLSIVNNRFQHGIFLISLDFELYWGVRDKRALSDYGSHLGNVPKVVDRLLSLFRLYNVHATWSTVGMLFHSNRDELRAALPTMAPGYTDQNLCPYQYLERSTVLEPQFHFAPALIKRIQETPGQEIGTHTYSHFYCLEDGATLESLRSDLEMAIQVGRSHNATPETLVFPRNQWKEETLRTLGELGIRAYRGNEKHWLYSAVKKSELKLWVRLLKFVDSYLNLTGHHTFGPRACGPSIPFNLPASRFLRPFSPRIQSLEPLKTRRILKAMERAARTGEAFHLWWHPHNFGRFPEENLRSLERILEGYQYLREGYAYQSLTMKEMAAGLESGSLLQPGPEVQL